MHRLSDRLMNWELIFLVQIRTRHPKADASGVRTRDRVNHGEYIFYPLGAHLSLHHDQCGLS